MSGAKRTARIVRRFKVPYSQGGGWASVVIEAQGEVGARLAEIQFDGAGWHDAIDVSGMGPEKGALRAQLIEWAADNDAYDLAQMDVEDRFVEAKRPRREWLRIYKANR